MSKRARNPQLCSKGDGDLVLARGLCRTHYHRWYRTSNPDSEPGTAAHPVPRRYSPETNRRFWALVDTGHAPEPGMEHLGPCLVWTGDVDPRGWARFDTGRGRIDAWRYAYRALYGFHPPTIREPGCHHESGDCRSEPCRHRLCVSPIHWAHGLADMVEAELESETPV